MSEVPDDSTLSADQGPAPAEPSPSQDSDMSLQQGRRPIWWHFSHAARRTRFCDYANILFVFVPIGLVMGILRFPAEIVFAVNLLALIRLAPLITFSIDELSPSVGRVFGLLMQPTSGNAVEMIVGLVALGRGEPVVARTNMLGSIIAYALLVLGSSFFIAGYDKQKLVFDKTMTNTMSTLMMAVSFCLIVPTVMSITSSAEKTKAQLDSDTQILSHVISITLLIIFFIYLRFRAWFLAAQNDHGATYETHQSGSGAESAFSHGLWATSCVLVCAIACTIASAFYAVGSIDGLSHALDINKTFISLVLLPLTGYVAKSVTIIKMARRCEMDFVMKSVVYSILQILLFVIPLLIVLGWLIDQPFTLDFNVFEGTVFFLNLIVMTSTIQDGKCNYFDGIMLVGTYILIAVAFYLRPDNWEVFLPLKATGLEAIKNLIGPFTAGDDIKKTSII